MQRVTLDYDQRYLSRKIHQLMYDLDRSKLGVVGVDEVTLRAILEHADLGIQLKAAIDAVCGGQPQ